MVRVERAQQRSAQLVVAILDAPVPDVVQQHHQGRNAVFSIHGVVEQRPQCRLSHPGLPGHIADRLFQRLAGRVHAANLSEATKEQGDDNLPSLRPVFIREMGAKQPYRMLPDQRCQRDRRPRPRLDRVGLFRECVEEGFQLVAPKHPHVSVQGDPHGIRLDKRESRRSVEGRQPRRQPAQFGHDYAVLSDHKGEHAAGRDSGIDAGVEEARAQELGQLAVRRNETAVRAGAEQVGPQGPLQCRLVAAGDILQAENVGVFG